MYIGCGPVINAQNVVQKGNIFVQVDTCSFKIQKKEYTLTKYSYMASDGTKYPIYMSAGGKCFIIRKSKNGKEYRQYMPEITKKLSK